MRASSPIATRWKPTRARAGFQIAADCWVERLKIATRPPPETRPNAEPDALDIDALIAAAAADPEFAAAIAEIHAHGDGKAARRRCAPSLQTSSDRARSLARDFFKGERA